MAGVRNTVLVRHIPHVHIVRPAVQLLDEQRVESLDESGHVLMICMT
jgi:hypothetical protein